MMIVTNTIRRKNDMAVYVCMLCGYEYDPVSGDPDHGIDEGTDFVDLPEAFECPLCGASKEEFEEVRDLDN